MRLIRFSFVVAAALLVAACAVDGAGIAPQLRVETINRVYDVPIDACVTAASKVRRFVAAAANDRPESVHASIEGYPGRCVTTIAKTIEQAGVDRSHIGLVPAVSSLHGVRVRIERLLVSHVGCHIADVFNRGIFTENGFDPALGCSTAAAIGGMVANPEDLDIGKGRIWAEGEPAASAVAALRGVHDMQAAKNGEEHSQPRNRSD